MVTSNYDQMKKYCPGDEKLIISPFAYFIIQEIEKENFWLVIVLPKARVSNLKSYRCLRIGPLRGPFQYR